MKLRSLVAGLAGGIAATAAGNRVLADRVPPIEPALDGTRHTYRWRGFDVSWVEAGDPDHPDVVLLHGIHTVASSREFEGVFESLAARHHVIAPDLVGFGTSDRPALRYTGVLYEALIRDFLRDETERPVVIASSLTASFAAVAAADVDDASVVLINPTDETGARNTFGRELLRSPVLGTGLFNLLVSKPSIRYFDRELAYYDAGSVSRDVVDYQYRTAHQPNARFAPASFVGGFLEPSVPLDAALSGFEGSVTLVWGREVRRPSLATGRTLADAANARLVVLDRSELLLHDEHPDEFIEAVSPSLPRFEDD
ncbi:MAG: alpha/beta fold hydrolase [archaeon]